MEHKLWIDGAWTDTQDGRRMTVENPATGAPLAEVINAGRADVDRAVQAAKTAFNDGRWSKKTPADRAKVLWKLADLLEANAELLRSALGDGYRTLESSVRNFDFDAALQALQAHSKQLDMVGE